MVKSTLNSMGYLNQKRTEKNFFPIIRQGKNFNEFYWCLWRRFYFM